MPYRIIAVLLFLSAAGILPAATPERDWSRFPAVVQSDANEDIYVIGDVHGDCNRLLRLLAGAQIIEAHQEAHQPDVTHVVWKAGRSILVFTGDLIDKGDRSLDVIDVIQTLGKSAAEQGGSVLSIMGNHEAEFLAGSSKNQVKEFANELTAHGMSPSDVAACVGAVGSFLCAEPFAVRIRDWFFSHGGNTQGRTMNELIRDLQAGVQSAGFGSRELTGGNSLLEARLGGAKAADGKPWFESDPRHDAQFVLTQYAQHLGLKHLVQGHQPANVLFADGVNRKKGEMFQRYGLIFFVDTGMSQAVDYSEGAVLLIKTGAIEAAIAICPDGSRTTIWDSRSNPAVGRANACGK